MSYTIVGVIGHIDHGKTSLVAALTGVDTDTHPEEKRRGITIDLGFASYRDGDDRFALIDAPGHQKYIGNLLAGVSSIDIGLLVVACDQGIQAQTLEHAAILKSLGVTRLIAVVSRIDLADEATRNELFEELDLFLAEYGFHQIPKVTVSTVTGEGLDELRQLLKRYARTSERIAGGSFRMPVDRVFTIEGRGCVVAGTPWNGSVSVGDHLQIASSGQLVRVRELEVHGEHVERSSAGLRTAMNLAGVSASELERGDELLSENAYRPSQRVVLQMTMFPDTPDLKCPATVQLHTATTSCAARILGVKRLAAGEQAIVIVDTEHPIVATFQQPCLFRRPYPIGSFAGGRILAGVDSSDRKSAPLLELGRKLHESDSALERLEAWVEFRGELNLCPSWAESQLALSADQLQVEVEQGIRLERFHRIDGHLVSSSIRQRFARAMIKSLAVHAESGDDAWMDEESLIRRLRTIGSSAVGRSALEQLIDQGQVVRVNRMVAIASKQTVLSKKQKARMQEILQQFHDSRTPPTIKELAQQFDMSVDAVSSLIRFATQQRILIDLGTGFFIERDVWNRLMSELKTMFENTSEMSVSEIRNGWDVTRKHAIPMLEYCDRNGWTVRRGDVRTAGPAIQRMSEVKPDDKSAVNEDQSLE